MNNEFGRIWKEVVVPSLEVLFQMLPEGTSGNHTKCQSSQLVSGPTIGFWRFQISSSMTYPAIMFGCVNVTTA